MGAAFEFNGAVFHLFQSLVKKKLKVIRFLLFFL